MRSRVASLAGLVVLGVTLASATQNPTPFVNQPLVPSAVAPGGAGFTLTVNGTGFVSGSTVNWNGSPRTTTFVSGSQVTASILGTDIATAATASVTVVSPAPGGGTSNVVFLPVREPATFLSLNTSGFGSRLDTHALTVGDFNKDGQQDMAVQLFDENSENSSVSILLGNGDGTFTQGAEYAVDTESMASADLNGDGNLDLVFGSSDPQGHPRLAVLLGNGDGTFQKPVYSPASLFPNQPILADLNGDGVIDVAAADGDSYCVFLGKGDGSFQPSVCTNFPHGNFTSLTVGDFNGDGKLDLVTANSSLAEVGVLIGNGDGTFQTTRTYPTEAPGQSLVTADLNGDGHLDLASTSYNANSVSILLGNGDGTFRAPSSVATALAPSGVAASDMNGDGKLDLVVGDYGLDVASVSVFLGNGDGTFQPYTSYSGGPEERYLALGDFNNDGRLDVAVTNGTEDVITILTQDDGSVVDLSAHKLTFPLQLQGTVSDPKLITLTNTGSSPITISSIGVTANFSELNNCSKTVQPGHFCKIVIYFTPETTGNIPGYLSITDNGGGSPQIVSLAGVATIVSISPGRLDFGSWPVGHVSTSQKVVVTNEGNGSMYISQIGILGPNGKDFSEVNACLGTLSAGASCTISVIFHPSAKGARSATLGIVDSGGGSPQKVPLTGTGT